MDERTRLELATSYLEHLVIYLRVGNTDSTFFGTLADSWYCYHRGGVFVKPTGSPRTLNNPSGRLELEAMARLPFVSVAAADVLHGRKPGRLVKDHMIPRAHLRKLAIEERAKLQRPADVEAFLLLWYRIGAITYEEHSALSRCGVNECMPPDWDGADCFARYTHAGIVEYHQT